jgi:hypothetical protein
MKLSAPKVIVWWIALILGVIAILVVLVPGIMPIAIIVKNAFWIMAVGWVLLVLATFLKGL